MALYNKGDKVIQISTKDKGVIVAIGPRGRGGRQLYKVSFNGNEQDELESNLMPDCNMDDPFERCRNNVYGSFVEFSKINTTFKIRNTNVSTVSSLKASKTLFKAYQFKPLLKFLNSDNKRLLVADEVGLGKTIEAGHIMLELKARNEFRNALVICPVSLQSKWRTELKDKFGLKFTIVDSLNHLVQMLRDHDGSVRAILNYEKIRSQKASEEKSEEQNVLLRYLEASNKKFSFVLCDEAHKMREETTQTYKGAKKIFDVADSVVFLTATPIMIKERNLYNLLHLLDSQRYSNYSIFEQGLRENAPFIRALSELTTKKELPAIAEDLANSKITIRQEINERVYTETHVVGEHFREFPLFKRIIDRMMNEEDTLILRSQLQYDIMSMSQMNQVFSRTRKREVTTDWSQAERHPYPCIIPLYDDEQEQFDQVIEDYIDNNSEMGWDGEQRMTQGGALGLVQKKRQVASSVYAYLNDYEQLVSGYDAFADMPDAKVDELLRIIKEVFKNGTRKLIVFGLFKKTLYYLSIRLKKAGYNSVMIHGDIDNRQDVLNEFQSNPDIHIMLSSEVGSEGLDMQFCNTMVNYDLPWNPMVVEQRIGRIDRFGQESPIVHIYNMIVQGSIQEDIYMRLLERIGIFHESIGEMEAILDPEIEGDMSKKGLTLHQMYSNMEKEFFCTNLSREECQKKIDEIAQAYINERENLKKIEEGLTNTLTNDAYFRNEINRIVNNNAYITEIELKRYIDQLIKEHLTTCRLVNQGEGIYTFEMPKSNTSVLRNFLLKFMPGGDENYSNYRQFINSIDELQTFNLTFDQEVAYKRRDIVFVNLYNPIIQSALLYFSQQHDSPERTFRFDVNQTDMGVEIKRGRYFLAVYQIETSKFVFGVKKISNTLYPILYTVEERMVVENEDVTTKFFGKVQTKGEYQRVETTSDIDADFISDMQFDMAEKIDAYRKSFVEELKLQAENSILMMRQQTEAFYKYRIKNLEKAVANAEEELQMAIYFERDDKEIHKKENNVRFQNNNLRTLIKQRDDELMRVSQDQQLEVRTSLLSINYVNVK